MAYLHYFNRVDCDDNAKPSHLANSAVLKLLEEEERQKQIGGKFIIITSTSFWFAIELVRKSDYAYQFMVWIVCRQIV